MNAPSSSPRGPTRRRPGLWFAALALSLTALPACDDGGSKGRAADATPPATDGTVRADRGVATDAGPPDDQGVDPDQGVDAGPTDPSVWAWLEARQAEVRQSPDHLPARAEALVAAGDAEAIFAFVRDSIAVVPSDRDTGYEAGDEYRWRTGPRGALRSGAGTPREIADLLADLLTRAGHPAHVVLGTWRPEGAEAGLAFWTRPRAALAFNPGIAQAELEALRAAADFDAPSDVPRTANTDARRAQLAQTLLAKIGPENAVGDDFDPELYEALPLVAVAVNGTLTYAHPFVPDAVFGEPYGDPEAFVALDAASRRMDLSVTLNAHTARGRQISAAQADFDLADAVGRPLSFGLVPALPTDLAMVTATDDLSTAMGAIVLRRDAALAEDFPNVFTGALLGLGGEAFERLEDGTYHLGSGPLEAPAPGVDPSAVRSLTVEASALSFPQVVVTLRPADGEGDFVPGLGTDAFALRDGETPRPYLLRRNTDAPRITVLYDTSASMPPWVLENADRIATGIADAVRLRAPRAEVSLVPTDSDLWASTLRAMEGRPDAIVYLTDGDATDDFDPADAQLFEQGPAPLVIAVGLGGETPELFDEFALRTEANVQVAADEATVLSLADAHLTGLPEGRYVLSHRAPEGATGERTVTVTLPNGVEASTRYTVPAPTDRVVGDAIVGVSVDVGINGEHARRHLVGRTDGARLTDAVEAARHAAAVRQSLRDRNWLFVEGDALLPAVALDAHISGLLSTRGAFELTDFSVEGVTAMAEAGIGVFPPEVLGAFLPVPSVGDAHLFAHLGRAAIVRHQRRAIADGPGVDPAAVGGLDLVRSLDLVPLRTWSAVGPTDGAGRFAAVLEGSLAPAFAEGAMYSEATVNLLDDDALVAYAGAETSFADPTSPAAVALAYPLDEVWYLDWSFVDANGASAAAWVVDARTGQAHALLADGSGGGAETVIELRGIATALDITNAIAGVLGAADKAAGSGFGVVLQLAKIVANSFGAAAILVATLSAAWEPVEVQQAVAAAACEASKHLKITPFGLGPEPLQWYTAAALTDIWGVACP